MNIKGFYHGKLRDTYRFPSKVETDDDFLEKLKDETFGESTTYSMISDRKQLMIASLRKWKGQSFSVFTYFITSHDAANRPGGYVAITVIIQDYMVSDRNKLYSIFEEVLNKLQLEQVLDSNRILIENFDEKKSFFASLMDDILSCISNVCGPFVPIPEYSKESEPSAFNVEDCNDDAFVKALKESGVSYVSKNFISMKENNEYKKKYEDAIATIQQLKQKAANQASAAASNSDKREKENARISKLLSENAELKEHNATLEKQIDDVVAAIGSVDKKVQGTKDIVAKSAKKVINNNSPWIRLSIVFPLINTILLAILLYLVSSNLNGLKKNLEDDPAVDGNLAQVKEVIDDRGQHEHTGTYTEAVNEEEESKSNHVAAQPVEETKKTPTITQTKDVPISITNQDGTKVINGGTVMPHDILTVTCSDPVAVGYKLYSSEGCTAPSNNGTIMILSTSNKAKFYFCHPNDREVPFEEQPNKRTLNINR